MILKTLDVKFEKLDVTDYSSLKKIVEDNGVSCVIHLAALLSSIAEKKPKVAIDVNVHTIFPILNVY